MSQRARTASGYAGLGDRAAALADWAVAVASEAARSAAIALGIAAPQGLQPIPVRVRATRSRSR